MNLGNQGFKKNILWILLFGSLVGMNETFLGSFSLPYRSVILSTITIFLFSLARYKIPLRWTTILIAGIAVMFKLNNLGIYNCSSNVLLCGPTALLLLGISYEVFAGLFNLRRQNTLRNYFLTCIFTALFAFGAFAILNTFILSVWDFGKLFEYAFIRASMTATFSGLLSIFTIYNIRSFNQQIFFNPYLVKSILGILVIGLWLFGSFSIL